MTVNEFNHEFHTPKNFREQIAVLYLIGYNSDNAYLLNSYVNVCLPGMASFDIQKPGSNSFEGWSFIDEQIEKNKARGVFHTHPAGFNQFSDHDWLTMKAFAKANGELPLWYGVQALDSTVAQFVCLYMVNSKVFCFTMEQKEMSPCNQLIILPLPPKITSHKELFIMNCY